MRWRSVVAMVMVAVTPVAAGKVPMVVVEERQRGGGPLSLSLSLSLVLSGSTSAALPYLAHAPNI